LKVKDAIKNEPSLEIEVSEDDGSIKIEAQNINSIAIKYYSIDTEMLFSKSPFLTD